MMVEIDTPGHTSVISKAHPEHIACAEASPWTSFANGELMISHLSKRLHRIACASALLIVWNSEPPAGQLRLANAQTIQFTANLLTAVAKMFPSTLFSTGGDEINANCYTQDAQTQQELSAAGKTFEQALDSFTQATHKAIEGQGKTPVVWEGQEPLSSTSA